MKSELLSNTSDRLKVEKKNISNEIRKSLRDGVSLKYFQAVSSKIRIVRTGNNTIIPPSPPIRRGRRRKISVNPENNCDDIFGMSYDTPYIHIRMTKYAGLGVFASTFIPAKTLVTEYCGNVCHDDDVRLPESHKTHMLSIEFKQSYIRGLQRPLWWHGVGSLVNSAIAANCFFEKDIISLRAYLVAKRDIRVGEELLVDYRLNIETGNESIADDDTISYSLEEYPLAYPLEEEEGREKYRLNIIKTGDGNESSAYDTISSPLEEYPPEEEEDESFSFNDESA